jgi:uncharacterized damage-inducible protein DinB
MDRLSSLRRLLAYDDWANREALAALCRAATPPPRAVALLAHVLAARRLWLGRLRQDRTPVPVWPEPDLDRCEALLGEVETGWRDYLAGLTETALDQPVAYVNTKGEPWTSTAADILTHVVLHSAYHRGQVATELGAHGLTPAVTDYIHGVRQGLVE